MFFYLKRVLKSPVFYICCLAMLLVMLLGCYEDLPHAGEGLPIIYFLIVTNSIGISTVLVPVISVVPFLFYYVDELEKRAMYYQLIRMKKTGRYVLGQVLAAVITPVMVVLVSLAAFTAVCIAFGAGFQTVDTMQQYFEGSIYGDGHMAWVYVVHAVAFLAFSVPWALVGVSVSSVTRNRYAIIASPFIICRLLSYITEMLSLDLLNPILTLLKGDRIYFPWGGIYYTLCYHAVLAFLLASFVFLAFQRRASSGGF